MSDDTTPTQPAAQPEPAPTKSGKIHAAICKIMSEVGAVGKNRENKEQHYKFRGIADVYLACQSVMASNGVHVVPEAIVAFEETEGVSRNGAKSFHVIQRTRFRAYADDGSFVQIEAIGEAIDYGDKAANKAASAAMKYALVQLFALPEEDPDIDTENASPEVKAEKAAAKPTAKAEKPLPVAVLLARLAELNIKGKEAVLKWMACNVGHKVLATKELKPAELEKLQKLADETPPPQEAQK